MGSIKQWHEDDRPREKLMRLGARNLSDAELLAILLGSGTRELSAVDVAKQVLSSQDYRYDALERLTVKELMQFKGIGQAKAVTLVAAFELGRRRAKQQAEEIKKIKDSQDVYNLLAPVMAHLDHEEFWVIYLRKGKYLDMEKIAEGGLDFSAVDLRILWKKVLDRNATEIIIAHNHPSGDLRVSDSDRKITEKILEAGKLLQIHLLDHLIITGSGFVSVLH